MKTFFTINFSCEIKSNLLCIIRNLLKLIKRKTNANETIHTNLNHCNCVTDLKSGKRNNVDNSINLIKKVIGFHKIRLKRFQSLMKNAKKKFNFLLSRMKRLPFKIIPLFKKSIRKSTL